MTPPDCVSATLGFQPSVKSYFARCGRGGVLYWDHDLFGSYGVRLADSSRTRIYPLRPNEMTPLPRSNPHVAWTVPTEALRNEAAEYMTDIEPIVVPYVLPEPRQGAVGGRIDKFSEQQQLEPNCPVILNPVRIFRVKGVETSIALLCGCRDAAVRRGDPVPDLLVVGRPAEEPDYASELQQMANSSDLRRY